MKNRQPKTAFIKPAREGLLVPYPGSARNMLAEEGATVQLNAWWRRRIQDGDAIVVKDPPKHAKSKSPKE